MCSSSSSSNMCAEHGRGCNSFDCETNRGGVSYESSVWRPILRLSSLTKPWSLADVAGGRCV